MFKSYSSALILAARIMLVLMAAGAVVIAFVLSRDSDHADGTSAGFYVCPMHAEVKSTHPGDCSICKMALEPVRAAETNAQAHGDHAHAHAAPVHAQAEPPLAGEPPKKYVCPMHPKITSPRPGSCSICKMDLEPAQAAESPAPDEPTAAGKPPKKYVCPMHPKVTSPSPGSCPICKMDLEPEKPAPKATPPARPHESASTFSVSDNAEMRHYEAVARVKHFPIMLEMRAPAWMEDREHGFALFHLDEIQVLAADEEGFFSPQIPRQQDPPSGIKVKLIDKKTKKWDRATAVVRFHVVDGKAAELDPLMTGSIKFDGKTRNGPVVQASAVLRSPEGPYVLVVTNNRRTLTKRPIEIGNVLFGYATLLSGLEVGEEVAATHAFFLDAERRRQQGVLQ
jgi:hypothetical protein